MKRSEISFKLLIATLVAISLLYLFIPRSSIGISNTAWKLEASKCSTRPIGEKLNCWSGLLDRINSLESLSAAFSMYKFLTDTYPDFSTDCHSYAHQLGQSAYKSFVNHKDIQLDISASMCSYGFYHGFIEVLVESSGDLKKATQFCDSIEGWSDKTLSPIPMRMNCYHGIGHGVTNVHDPQLIELVTKEKNPQEIINLSDKVCSSVSLDKETLFYCQTGIFGGVSGVIKDHLNWFDSSPEGVFSICNQDTSSLKEACFRSLGSLIIPMFMNTNQVSTTIPIIMSIKDDQYKNIVAEEIANSLARENISSDYLSIIKFCNKLRENVKIYCINGVVVGLLSIGIPEQQFPKVLAVCDNALLNAITTSACVNKFITYSKTIYDSKTFSGICRLINYKFQTSCSTL